MNLIEFYATYQKYRDRDEITIACGVAGCEKTETLLKSSAYNNIKTNGEFLCRSHCFTEEGRKRISKATSYKRSEKTKKQMADSANKKWESDWGKKQKKKLAKKAALQNASTDMNKSKRKVLYISAKNGGQLRACNSSGEFVACEDFLETSPNIFSYETQVPYEINGRDRSLDFLINYSDGSKKVIEVKPLKRMGEEENILQISDSRAYAEQQGWAFELWTEGELGIKNWKEARDRADAYRKEHYDLDYGAYRAEKDRERAKRHYDTKISQDKVAFFCEFCKMGHEILRVNYDKNLERNGRYICEWEGGHIAGSKPKEHLRKENVYADLGKKQCTKCQRILPLESFSPDKSRRDGRSNRCKECRANFYKDKYNSR